MTYLRIKGSRALKDEAKPKSQLDLVTQKADEVELACDTILNGLGEETVHEVFRKLAGRKELHIFETCGLLVTIKNLAALRDFCGVSTTKMLKLKQAMEILPRDQE